MPARKYTPEESATARERKLVKQRERNRKRRSNPEYLAAERLKQSETRRNWSQERRDHSNKLQRNRYAKLSPDKKAKIADYMRKYALRTKYEVSKEEWDSVFQSQGNKCACCDSTDPKSKLGWSTDHCHVTGKLRGILCHRCNLKIGHLGDNFKEALNSSRLYLTYLAKTEGIDYQSS